MTPKPQANKTIDELTQLLAGAGCDEDTAGQFIFYVKALITEARIDELGGVQLEYGHYNATTYITGESQSILDRLAQLRGGSK